MRKEARGNLAMAAVDSARLDSASNTNAVPTLDTGAEELKLNELISALRRV